MRDPTRPCQGALVAVGRVLYSPGCLHLPWRAHGHPQWKCLRCRSSALGVLPGSRRVEDEVGLGVLWHLWGACWGWPRRTGPRWCEPLSGCPVTMQGWCRCSTGIFRACLGILCCLFFLLVKRGRILTVLPGTPQCQPHKAGANHCCRPHIWPTSVRSTGSSCWRLAGVRQFWKLGFFMWLVALGGQWQGGQDGEEARFQALPLSCSPWGEQGKEQFIHSLAVLSKDFHLLPHHWLKSKYKKIMII